MSYTKIKDDKSFKGKLMDELYASNYNVSYFFTVSISDK